jgi:hypothetical protein
MLLDHALGCRRLSPPLLQPEAENAPTSAPAFSIFF